MNLPMQNLIHLQTLNRDQKASCEWDFIYLQAPFDCSIKQLYQTQIQRAKGKPGVSFDQIKKPRHLGALYDIGVF